MREAAIHKYGASPCFTAPPTLTDKEMNAVVLRAHAVREHG